MDPACMELLASGATGPRLSRRGMNPASLERGAKHLLDVVQSWRRPAHGAHRRRFPPILRTSLHGRGRHRLLAQEWLHRIQESRGPSVCSCLDRSPGDDLFEVSAEIHRNGKQDFKSNFAGGGASTVRQALRFARPAPPRLGQGRWQLLRGPSAWPGCPPPELGSCVARPTNCLCRPRASGLRGLV